MKEVTLNKHEFEEHLLAMYNRGLSKALYKEEENNISDHFVEVNKIMDTGATSKPIADYELSRYAGRFAYSS